MGRVQDRFSEALKALRKERRWSQGELEKRLAAKGIQLHATTIAKIEKGERPVNITEAAAIADLFGRSMDELSGRGWPDDSTLTFAMVTALNYVGDAQKQTMQVLDTVGDIGDMLEDVAERFDSPYFETMQCAAREMADHLEKARALAKKLEYGASQVIVDEGEGKQK